MLLARPTLMLWSAMIVAVLAAAAMPSAAHAQAVADIDAANKQVEQLYADRKYAEATPLAEATLALAERLLGAVHRSTLSSVANLALLHSGQGNDGKAEPLYRRALEASERVLGSEDPDTLINLNNLAVFYETQRRYAEAEPLMRRAVEVSERTLGPEHADTLTSVHNLAVISYAERRFEQAEALFKRAVEARERVLGKEHPDTLASISDLADLYRDLGRKTDAEPLFKHALEASERVLGHDHPHTLARFNNLATFYVTQERYAEAEPLFIRALGANERLLGVEHPVTLVNVSNLASVYQGQGRYPEAESLMRRCLEGRERTLGHDHPETLASASNLAALYFVQTRYDEAETLFKRAAEARERVLGADHADTLASISDLAILYRTQNRFGDAEPLYRRALDASERLLGKEHPDTLARVDTFAALYHSQNRYGDAEPLYMRGLAAREHLLGKDDPNTLAAVNNLAALYSSQGRLSAADPLYRRVLEARARVLGNEHLETLASMTALAQHLLRQRHDNEAEPLMKRALEAAERLQGKDHPDTLLCLSNLAGLYFIQGRYGEAEPLFRRVLDTAERVRGPEHPDAITGVNNLALLYVQQERYGEAEPLLKRAMEANERVRGKEHLYTLASILNLAGLYQVSNRHGEAEPLYRRALEAFERVFGGDHPQTLLTLNNLGRLYGVQRRYGEAEPLYRRALAASERVLGGEHPQTLASVVNLGELYFVQRDWSRAAEFWRRSTAAIVARTRRGVLDAGQGLSGRKQSEAEQASEQFAGLVKAVHRLSAKNPGLDQAGRLETFQTAQWALSSEAARSLAQMAARGASGDPELAGLARERQDLVAEWRTRDGLSNAALGEAPDKRNASAEAENRKQLGLIDARITAIDKRLAADFPDYAALASPAPLSAEDVQAQLGADEALLLFLDLPEFGPTPAETFIWVVTKTTLRRVRSDLGTEALTRDVQALRCGLDEEEWATASNARRCGDLLGLADMPDGSRPLPFSLGKAHALYKSLFGEIEELIADKRLLIVPSGALTGLPFQVLVTKKPKVALPRNFEAYRDVAWLGRRNAITTLPAVSSLKALRQHAADRRPATEAYAGFGNPLLSGDGGSCRSANTPAACPSLDAARRRTALGGIGRATVRGNGGSRNASANMDQVFANGSTPVALLGQVRGLCPLADTAYEINCIAERFKGQSPLIRLAGEATEANIKALSQSGQLARYRVLHLATHGLLSGDVERMAQRQGEPALVLSPPDKPAGDGDDGLLMASEVAALKLNADWVVLSACNTAAGDQIGGQALSGLARAFFYAGGRTLLVSHWPVYSDAAVRLTTRAFAELDRDPKAGRAEALRKAMTALMEDRSQTDNAHPAVWAPFIVVGEGGDAPPGRQSRAKR